MASSYYYHYYRRHKELGNGILRWSLVLWLLGLTTVLLLVLLYSPNPFTATSMMVIDLDFPDNSNNHIQDGDLIEERSCDLGNGRWVRDDGDEKRPPAYTNQSCSTMPESKDCIKYGKDMEYLHWRWKPNDCELPRFDPERFLRIVGGKKMAFVGDSVARNHFESLVCLLSQADTPTMLYKDSEDRFRTYHFPSHNFTLLVLWTRFLVQGNERTINGSGSGVFDLHVEKMDVNWAEKLPGVDIAVISDGHWFFRKNYIYESGNLIGCIFCSEPNITNLDISFTIRKVFRTALQFINSCEDCNDGLITLLRTFSPAHFENGSWNNGGSCNRTRPTSEEETDLSGSTYWDMSRGQVEEIERIQEGIGGKKKFKLLQVTRAMVMRGDGHPGSHWNNEWMKGYNDCVHWCLPGPIDLWNELLLDVLRKIIM